MRQWGFKYGRVEACTHIIVVNVFTVYALSLGDESHLLYNFFVHSLDEDDASLQILRYSDRSAFLQISRLEKSSREG